MHRKQSRRSPTSLRVLLADLCLVMVRWLRGAPCGEVIFHRDGAVTTMTYDSRERLVHQVDWPALEVPDPWRNN